MSIFSSVPITKLSRSTFNLDHESKLSFNFGGLYPILTQTILPGDKMSLGVQSFVRTVPLLSPVMHRNDIKVDAFFVPMRLIWDNAEAWQSCKDETIKMPVAHFGANKNVSQLVYDRLLGPGSLSDYLGFASVPFSRFNLTTIDDEDFATNTDVRTVNCLPFRCYQLIYDYYYRNKTLEDPLEGRTLSDSSSYDIKSNSDHIFTPAWSNNNDLFCLRYRSWRRDPFTSALPSPQKGNPVLLPESVLTIAHDGPLKLSNQGSADNIDNNTVITDGTKVDGIYNLGKSDGTASGFKNGYSAGLKINKSDSPTIEDLRYAEVLEEYEEALARAGAGEEGSFKEWLLAIWRTLSPDARLDRPEYLGGYRGPITISEVPQTSEGTESSAQGTLAGKGLSVGGQRLFKNHTFKEAGYLMVIMSVVPKSCYFQGDPRQFLYDNCYEWPNPYFANLGEQEVLSQEINAAQSLLNSDQQRVFGYNVRNYEMKQIPDSVHGALRDSLLYWHESRKFDDTGTTSASCTNLNDSFIKMYPREVSRIFPEIETSDKLIGEFFFSFKAKRSLPYYGIPRIGHTK